MIVIKHEYTTDCKIQPERELKESELNYIASIVKPDCIEYYYEGDVLPYNEVSNG
jgi:hypothetical protein